VQHWLGKAFRQNSFRPGLKELDFFKFTEQEQPAGPVTGGSPFSHDELSKISASVRKLRQERKEEELMQEPPSLLG
jgi:hypothetical protein